MYDLLLDLKSTKEFVKLEQGSTCTAAYGPIVSVNSKTVTIQCHDTDSGEPLSKWTLPINTVTGIVTDCLECKEIQAEYSYWLAEQKEDSEKVKELPPDDDKELVTA